MTHDIVPSEIEFAEKLHKALCADEEVIAALVRRRVHPASAARLVADLKNRAARTESCLG